KQRFSETDEVFRGASNCHGLSQKAKSFICLSSSNQTTSKTAKCGVKLRRFLMNFQEQVDSLLVVLSVQRLGSGLEIGNALRRRGFEFCPNGFLFRHISALLCVGY